MTPAQVKRALRENRKAGRRPWSQYQLAAMYGCSRSLVSEWLKRKKTSQRLAQWCDRKLNHAA